MEARNHVRIDPNDTEVPSNLGNNIFHTEKYTIKRNETLNKIDYNHIVKLNKTNCKMLYRKIKVGRV